MSNQWYDIDSWQWTDNDNNQWGFSTEQIIGYEGLYQIWTDEKYVYAATSSGLKLTNIETEEIESYATNPNGYTTVWSDDTEAFIGTTNDGIKKIIKSEISPGEIISIVKDFAKDYDITNNNIKYIHGNSNKLICSTIEGIDIIRRASNYRTYTTISGAQKCFITPQYDYIYYTVSGTGHWSINRLNNNTQNWQNPDIIYTTGSGFLSSASIINDIFVTEHTSTNNINNTLFIATDIGIYAYDEGSNYYLCYTISSASGIQSVAGTSSNYAAIWTDNNANIDSGNMYIATTGSGAAFSVIDLANQRLIDSYMIDKIGNNNEVLNSEDIVDINVSTIGI